MREKEVEKKGGKEDESPTMPLMLFNFYRVIRSWRKGRDFFARLEYKQDGIPFCRGCGHSGVVFYDHYYRKAKVASICSHKGASIQMSEMRKYLSRADTGVEKQQANIRERQG